MATGTTVKIDQPHSVPRDFSLVHFAAAHLRAPFWVACNASHPMWRDWRGKAGYFVIESGGRPCWVGAADADMKGAFTRWLHAGAPA